MSNAVAKIRVPAKSYGKCSCGERWIKDERMYILKFEDAKDKKICRFCAEGEECAEYTQTEWEGMAANAVERRSETIREAFGGYLASGNTSEFFNDLNNGYV